MSLLARTGARLIKRAHARDTAVDNFFFALVLFCYHVIASKLITPKSSRQILLQIPSLLKAISVQDQPSEWHSQPIAFNKNVCGTAEFGLALGCQINEADKANTGKLIAECIIGGILFGCFVALIAANYANR